MLLWYNRYGFLYTCARRAILMNQERLNDLNTAYYRLETKQAEIIHALSHGIFELESGWYNGHYHKGDNDNWVRESYPIPVIEVKGLCDIEIQFDKISVSTKLQRNTVLAYSFEKFDKILLELIEKNKKIYSAAYIMPSGMCFGQSKKHQNNLRLLEMIMADDIAKKIDECNSLESLYKLMINYPSIGPFLGFQYTIDINYSNLSNFSEMDYVVAGPGAISGISKCFDDISQYSPEDIIKFMAEIQEEEFERLGLSFKYLGKRKLQLIDCQNIFCETDKYTRVAYPDVVGNNKRTRIKQLFNPNLNNSIQFFYPPKWDITL